MPSVQCVVKTYLQWLNDTDFDPNCQLCKSSLDDGRETIRLPCFGELCPLAAQYCQRLIERLTRRLPLGVS